MKLRLLLFLAMVLGGMQFANAQTCPIDWIRTGGGRSIDNAMAVAVDNAGFVYTTGFFNATAAFETFNGSISSVGGDDVFVAKYTPSGNMVWLYRAGASAGNSDKGMAIDVDATGAVYVTGMFNSRATFGNTVLTSRGESDIFILKLNTNGVQQWVRQIGGAARETATGIIVGLNNDIFVAGAFSATCVFGTNVTVTSRGDLDGFIARYDANGVYNWNRTIGSSAQDYATGIDIDPQGNLYVSGYFSSSDLVLPNSGLSNLRSNGATDGFVVSYSGNGLGRWARAVGGSGQDFLLDITVDATGGVYAAGRARGLIFFPDGRRMTTNAGSDDALIWKLSTTGATMWARLEGGTGTDVANCIALDGNNGLYVGGMYQGTFPFANQTLTSNNGTSDMLLLKYNTVGNRIWAKGYGGAAFDQINGLDASGNNIYAAGFYSNRSTGDNNSNTPIRFDQFASTPVEGLQDAITIKWGCTSGCALTVDAGTDKSNCGAGVQMTASSTPAAGVTYAWMPTTALTNRTFPTTIANPTVATTYTLYATDAFCTVSDEVYVDVVNNLPVPTVSVEGALTFCPGGFARLTAGNTAFLPFQWQRNNVVIPNATGNTLNVTEAGSYTVVVISSNCASPSLPVVVSLAPAPNAIITAAGGGNSETGTPAVICQGNSVNLNTTVTNVSTGVTFSWSPASGLSSVNIPNPSANPTTSTVYTVTVNDGTCSATASIRVLVQSSGLPGRAAVSGVTSATATLSWNPVQGVSVYNVEYRRCGEATFITKQISDGSTFTTLDGLTPSTCYEARVSTPCAQAGAAQTVQFTTNQLLTCVIPGVPVVLNRTANTAVVQWNRVDNAVSYQLEWREPGDDAYTVVTVNQTGAGAISSTITGLLPDRVYLFRVRANCPEVVSTDYTDEVTINRAQSQTCTTPTAFNASNITNTTANLSWSTVAGATYEVTITPAISGSPFSTSNTSLSLTGLTAGTSYTATVVAICSGGVRSGAATRTFSTTGGGGTTCVTPSGLAVAGSTTVNAATLTWGSVAGATSYRLRYRPVGGTNVGWMTLTDLTGTSRAITGLNASTEYEAQVAAVCGSTTSAFGPATAVRFLTQNGDPGCVAPSSVSVSNNTTLTPTFSWGAIPAATNGYRVQYRINTAGTPWSTVNTTNTSLSPSQNLNACTGYVVRVGSRCADNTVVYSNTVTFTTVSGTGSPCARLSETLPTIEGFDAVVYPNPARNTTQVRFISAQDASITYRLTDLTGRIIRMNTTAVTAGESTHELDLHDLTPGLYLLQLHDGLTTKAFRLRIE